MEHTPDVDEGFAYYALATGKIDTGDLELKISTADIQTLNDRASRGDVDITTISTHSYAYVKKRYVLSTAGGTFGQGCGARIVARDALTPDDIVSATIATGGTTTSAFLVAQLFHPHMRSMVLPFDKLIPAVRAGVVDCGLLVLQDQMTIEEIGMQSVVDLGQWWADTTDNFPLPLKALAIRKELDESVRTRITSLIGQSIQYAMQNRAEALDFAMRYARGLSRVQVGQYITEYVNDLTLDAGQIGKNAVEELLKRAAEAGITPEATPVEWC